jgi:hypothetical protein
MSSVNRLESALLLPIKLGLFCNTQSECASLVGLVLAFRLNSFSGAAFVAALRGRRRSRR